MSIKTIHPLYESEPVSGRDQAEMLSFRFISEIDRLMERNDISKKELARRLGTSASYITQLFKGDKLLNMEILARTELVFGVRFCIEAQKVQAVPEKGLRTKNEAGNDRGSYTGSSGKTKPLFAREAPPRKSRPAKKK